MHRWAAERAERKRPSAGLGDDPHPQKDKGERRIQRHRDRLAAIEQRRIEQVPQQEDRARRDHPQPHVPARSRTQRADGLQRSAARPSGPRPRTGSPEKSDIFPTGARPSVSSPHLEEPRSTARSRLVTYSTTRARAIRTGTATHATAATTTRRAMRRLPRRQTPHGDGEQEEAESGVRRHRDVHRPGRRQHPPARHPPGPGRDGQCRRARDTAPCSAATRPSLRGKPQGVLSPASTRSGLGRATSPPQSSTGRPRLAILSL